MQLQLVRAGEPRQFDEIVTEFTPPMQRVCRHMAEAQLRAMIERMAAQQLADERRYRASRPPRPISRGTSFSSSRAR